MSSPRRLEVSLSNYGYHMEVGEEAFDHNRQYGSDY